MAKERGAGGVLLPLTQVQGTFVVPRIRGSQQGRRRAGGAVRIREHYLRSDDASLLITIEGDDDGASDPDDASRQAGPNAGASERSSNKDSGSRAMVLYAMLDAKMLSCYLDLFSDESFRSALLHPQTGSEGSNVRLIFLQSALSEAGEGMTARQQRSLRALVRRSHGSLLFFNQHCAHTYTHDPGASKAHQPLARSGLALNKAAAWLQSHLGRQPSSKGTITRTPAEQQQFAIVTDDAQEKRGVSSVGEEPGSAPAVMTCEELLNCVLANSGKGLKLRREELLTKRKALAEEDAAERENNPEVTMLAGEAVAGEAVVGGGAAPAPGADAGPATLQGVLEVMKHNPREAMVKLSKPSASSSTDQGGGSGNTKPSREVLIQGRESMNRAVQGDVVAVRLLPSSQWQTPTSRRRLTFAPLLAAEDDQQDETGGAAQSGSESLHCRPTPGSVPTGVVVSVVDKQRRRPFVVTIPREELDRGESGGEMSILTVPMDSRIPKIRMRTRQLQHLAEQRLVVVMDGWDEDSVYPNGHYVRSLGPVGAVSCEVAAMLVEHEAGFDAFSPRALACLPAVPQPPHEPQSFEALAEKAAAAAYPGGAAVKGGGVDTRTGDAHQGGSGVSDGEGKGMPPPQFRRQYPWTDSRWQLPAEEASKRRDLRGDDYNVFSVDPPGCQDIDDAMHVRSLGGGRIEVGVHIADVTHFVEHDGALDREARQRGTTVYLTHTRYDMLPALLSSDLCSLHGGKDRLAVSVLWELEVVSDKDGQEEYRMVPPPPDRAAARGGGGGPAAWLGRTAIHSKAAMTYNQADDLLSTGRTRVKEGRDPPPGQAGGPIDEALQPSLAKDLWALTHFARALRRQRTLDGSMDLSGGAKELSFGIDDESGEPLTMGSAMHMEVHEVIEELMILANSSVAAAIYASFPTAALLRSHSAPLADTLEALGEEEALQGIFGKSGQSADSSSTGKQLTVAQLQQAVATSKQGSSQEEREAASMLVSLVTRSMAEAQYVSSGTLTERQQQQQQGDKERRVTIARGSSSTRGVAGAFSPLDDDSISSLSPGQKGGGGGGGGVGAKRVDDGRFQHFGLGINLYTHFTSPIRRYADVVVHRLLMAALESGEESRWQQTALKARQDWLGVEGATTVGDTAAAAAAAAGGGGGGGGGGGRGRGVAAAGIMVPSSKTPSIATVGAAGRVDREGRRRRDIGTGQLVTQLDGTSTVEKVSSTRLASVHAAEEEEDADALLDALLGLGVDDEEEQQQSRVSPPLPLPPAFPPLTTSTSDPPPPPPNGPPGFSEEWVEEVGGDEAEDAGSSSSSSSSSSRSGSSGCPFTGREVGAICEVLNDRTRRAKRLSFECTQLFLRLYFAKREQVVTAVVFALRENGFLAYVPAFDVKGPVYLCDQTGLVQMNPALLALPEDSGSPPSSAFDLQSSSCRALPGASLALKDGEGGDNRDCLTVSPPGLHAAGGGGSGGRDDLGGEGRSRGRRLQLRRMDVVQVAVTCNVKSTAARLPPLRLHLMDIGAGVGNVQHHHSSHDHSSKTSLSSQSSRLQQLKEQSDSVGLGHVVPSKKASAVPRTVYSIVRGAARVSLDRAVEESEGQQKEEAEGDGAVYVEPTMEEGSSSSSSSSKVTGKARNKTKSSQRVEISRGRIRFGGYTVMDRLEATQLLYQSIDDISAEQGGGGGSQGWEGASSLQGMNDMKQRALERQVMDRTLRLQQAKRETRIKKAKKENR